jgi:hypothetical protein
MIAVNTRKERVVHWSELDGNHGEETNHRIDAEDGRNGIQAEELLEADVQ